MMNRRHGETIRRQTGMHADWKKNRTPSKQTNKQNQTGRKADIHTSRQAGRLASINGNRKNEKQPWRKAKQTNRKTRRKADKQTNRQADTTDKSKSSLGECNQTMRQKEQIDQLKARQSN